LGEEKKAGGAPYKSFILSWKGGSGRTGGGAEKRWWSRRRVKKKKNLRLPTGCGMGSTKTEHVSFPKGERRTTLGGKDTLFITGASYNSAEHGGKKTF